MAPKGPAAKAEPAAGSAVAPQAAAGATGGNQSPGAASALPGPAGGAAARGRGGGAAEFREHVNARMTEFENRLSKCEDKISVALQPYNWVVVGTERVEAAYSECSGMENGRVRVDYKRLKPLVAPALAQEIAEFLGFSWPLPAQQAGEPDLLRDVREMVVLLQRVVVVNVQDHKVAGTHKPNHYNVHFKVGATAFSMTQVLTDTIEEALTHRSGRTFRGVAPTCPQAARVFVIFCEKTAGQRARKRARQADHDEGADNGTRGRRRRQKAS
jgi:hypothetical protein